MVLVLPSGDVQEGVPVSVVNTFNGALTLKITLMNVFWLLFGRFFESFSAKINHAEYFLCGFSQIMLHLSDSKRLSRKLPSLLE